MAQVGAEREKQPGCDCVWASAASVIIRVGCLLPTKLWAHRRLSSVWGKGHSHVAPWPVRGHSGLPTPGSSVSGHHCPEIGGQTARWPRWQRFKRRLVAQHVRVLLCCSCSYGSECCLPGTVLPDVRAGTFLLKVCIGILITLGACIDFTYMNTQSLFWRFSFQQSLLKTKFQ